MPGTVCVLVVALGLKESERYEACRSYKQPWHDKAEPPNFTGVASLSPMTLHTL